MKKVKVTILKTTLDKKLAAGVRDGRHMKAILYAFLAAVFYAINIPVSKMLLGDVGPATMAALLYLGAGVGIAGLSLFNAKDRRASAPLSCKDLPYVVGMIVLDIAAPVFLMFGIRHGSSANTCAPRTRLARRRRAPVMPSRRSSGRFFRFCC